MIELKDLKYGQLVVAQLKDTNSWIWRRPEFLEPFEAKVVTAYGTNWVGLVPLEEDMLDCYLHIEDGPEFAGMVLEVIEQQEEEDDGQSS